MTVRPSHVDIFCRVIDNFGDVGTCWRLARQLTVEEGISTRLIVDRLEVAKALVPEINLDADFQAICGVVLQHWHNEGLRCEADMVIEAFACELPCDYLETMALRAIPPVWINLEYLSSEPWVASHHQLPSPHPQVPLTKYFFFPGFHEGAGGLIRERHIFHPQTPAPHCAPMLVFAFAYSAGCIKELCAAVELDDRPANIRVFGHGTGKKLQIWRATQGENRLNTASTLEFAEFVPQSEFDGVLASHDVLMVRGEDSMVRALWSGKPFVWQLYKQADNAHHTKLEAFLECYGEGMPADLKEAWAHFSRAWNGMPGPSIAETWPILRDQWQAWSAFAHARAMDLMRHPDLASNLLSFFGKLARI